MSQKTGRHVAIIGAGAVGVISAIEALRDGHRVTLIDPGEPGGSRPRATAMPAGCHRIR